ncbi:uncharacterized protein LOC127723945 [Mytilus californianus]|uniref:uncharacterized protein LOC127723945 n=1 Tax=Mytilus californianus TaxID=6549 RepID=UPI002244FDA5|nr:uncharacterized protein LOC127723945 [Mytilus californianus]
MPTSCIETDHCGTITPIWFQGILPSAQQGAVEGKGCINRGKEDYLLFAYGGTKCCHEDLQICAKNCNGYYVYRLTRSPGCSISYCADYSTAGCSYTFIYNPINHKCEAKIKIVATRDFVKDGDKTHTLSFKPIETAQNKHLSLQNIMWMKHQISPIQIHIQSNKACYAHQKAACICGIVAQEGNDIVEINGCTQRKNVYYVSNKPYCIFNIDEKGFNTEHKPSVVVGDKKSTTQSINFPSGARLTVTTNDQNQMLSPVNLEIPSDHKGCAEGQCGSFDGRYIDRNVHYLRKRSLPTWPTATGKTLSYAVELCKIAFQKASLYPYCKVNVDGYTGMIEGCTEDIKPNTCEIDGQCRQKGEQNSEQHICEPSVNQLKWTTDQRVTEIDHFTASLTGCLCVDDPGSFSCACCQNAGCPCASLSPHQCVDCKHQDECGKYPEIFNI